MPTMQINDRVYTDALGMVDNKTPFFMSGLISFNAVLFLASIGFSFAACCGLCGRKPAANSFKVFLAFTGLLSLASFFYCAIALVATTLSMAKDLELVSTMSPPRRTEIIGGLLAVLKPYLYTELILGAVIILAAAGFITYALTKNGEPEETTYPWIFVGFAVAVKAACIAFVIAFALPFAKERAQLSMTQLYSMLCSG